MIGGTRGGLNRARLIDAIHVSPQNAHQLSQELNLDYSTIRHHLDALQKNGLVTSLGDSYGMMYFLSDNLLANYGFFEEIWEKIGNKKKKRDEEKMIDE
jgi:DNA-binding transcriptional ArsR family regulator